MTTTLTIDGDRITGIASFYDEINRVFMAGEDWKLGQSLDALDDMLYGAYGALKDGPARLVWTGFEKSRAALGIEATRALYRFKLGHPEQYYVERIAGDLAALERGEGPTYFDQVLEIIAEHPDLELVVR